MLKGQNTFLHNGLGITRTLQDVKIFENKIEYNVNYGIMWIEQKNIHRLRHPTE